MKEVWVDSSAIDSRLGKHPAAAKAVKVLTALVPKPTLFRVRRNEHAATRGAALGYVAGSTLVGFVPGLVVGLAETVIGVGFMLAAAAGLVASVVSAVPGALIGGALGLLGGRPRAGMAVGAVTTGLVVGVPAFAALTIVGAVTGIVCSVADLAVGAVSLAGGLVGGAVGGTVGALVQRLPGGTRTTSATVHREPAAAPAAETTAPADISFRVPGLTVTRTVTRTSPQATYQPRRGAPERGVEGL